MAVGAAARLSSPGAPVIALHLLRAKLRALFNLRRSAQMGRKRLLVLVVLGALTWVGILAASHRQ